MFTYVKLAERLIGMTDIDWTGREEQKKTCRYGLELLLATTVNLILVITIAGAIGKLPEIMLYLSIWASLRLTAGGIHAPNHRSCIVTFLIAMLIVIYGGEYLSTHKNLEIISIGIMVLCFFINLRYAGEHKKNLQQKKELKIRTLRVLTIEIFVVLLLCQSGTAGMGTQFQYEIAIVTGAVLMESVFLLPWKKEQESETQIEYKTNL